MISRRLVFWDSSSKAFPIHVQRQPPIAGDRPASSGVAPVSRFAVGPGEPSGSEPFDVQVAVKRTYRDQADDSRAETSLLQAPWSILVKRYSLERTHCLCEYSNSGALESRDPAKAWDVPALIDEREMQIIETLKSWGAARVRQETRPTGPLLDGS
jgi:hypothetical protein